MFDRIASLEESLRKKFLSTNLPLKLFLLILASSLPVYAIYLEYKRLSQYPATLFTFNSQPNISTNVLAHFDTFIVIALCCFLAFLFSILAGRPEKPTFVSRKFKNHPILLFFSVTIFFSLMLNFAPTALSEVVMANYSSKEFSSLKLSTNVLFIKEATMAAVCVGISLMDIVLKPKVPRLVPFILILVYNLGYFPLLCWNFLARFLPSKYWALWRPVLAFATCVAPMVIFPGEPPLTHKPTARITPAKQVLEGCFGYSVQKVSDKNEIILRCGHESGCFRRYKRNSEQLWKESDQVMIQDSLWNKASFDYKRNLVYLVDGSLKSGHCILNVFNYPDLSVHSIHSIPVNAFPVPSSYLHQAFDPENDILLVASEKKFLVTLDVNTFQILRVRFFPEGSAIWEVAYDPKNKAFLCLMQSGLYALKTDTLEPVKTIQFNSDAIGMYVDSDSNIVFLAFPKNLEVCALDLDTFELTTRYKAPVGVRRISVDHKNRLLFLSSISGELEIRDVDTFERKGRIRLSFNPHWIEVFPEYGELIVTFGDEDPVVVKYDPPKLKVTIFDWMFFITEDLYQTYINLFGKSDPVIINKVQKQPELFNGSETILISSDIFKDDQKGNDFESQTGVGYNIIFAEDKNEFVQLLDKRNDRIDYHIQYFSTPEGIAPIPHFQKKRNIPGQLY